MDAEAPLLDVQERTAAVNERRRYEIGIAVAYLLILAVEWTPRPLQRVLWIAAAVGVVLIVSQSFEGWRAMGFRTKNLVRSLWIAGAALALAVVLIAIASRVHTLLVPAGTRAFVGAYLGYALWSGVQQFLLLGVFLLRFLRLVARPAAAAAMASALFSLAHLPNPILTPVTFVWGLAACMLFLRYRNIYPLMIAHAVLGIAVSMTVPGSVDHNMRVGLGYLTYNPRAHLHRVYR